jgi:cell division protein ZapD
VEEYVVYEQPLNERIRTLLRLESLFDQANHHLAGNTEWDTRAALEQCFAIQEVAGRSELRTDIVKELERHSASLGRLQERPDIDHRRLQDLLDRLGRIVERLMSIEGLGHEFKDHELLSAVRQRRSIPGGTCAFDLPAFHRWLQRPAEARSADIRQWFGRYDAFEDAVRVLLGMVRQSATGTREVAEGGFFQYELKANRPFQLIQVTLPSALPLFPEISGGRHRFTVRFMYQASFGDRPTQVSEDIPFQLTCCLI